MQNTKLVLEMSPNLQERPCPSSQRVPGRQEQNSRCRRTATSREQAVWTGRRHLRADGVHDGQVRLCLRAREPLEVNLLASLQVQISRAGLAS